MARPFARIVGGLSYDAALSDGHHPQFRHDGAGFPHSSAAGGARRSNHIFCGRISSKHAQRACVRSQRDQPRCENTEKLLRQARQGIALRSICLYDLSSDTLRDIQRCVDYEVAVHQTSNNKYIPTQKSNRLH